MMILSLCAPPSLHADEPPPSLIRRGLAHRGLPRLSLSHRRALLRRFVPELRLRAIVDEGSGPAGARTSTLVVGELRWPLGQHQAGDDVALTRARRLEAAERDALVDKIADAWHRRRAAEAETDAVTARLLEEEADAEIEALVGERDEEAP